MRILSPSSPRTIGRPEFGPNWLLATPSSEPSASPTLFTGRSAISEGLMRSAGVSAETVAPKDDPLTVMVSIAFGVWADNGWSETADSSKAEEIRTMKQRS